MAKGVLAASSELVGFAVNIVPAWLVYRYAHGYKPNHLERRR